MTTTDTTSEDAFLATPLENIPANSPLPFPVFVRVAGKLTCLRNTGDTMTEERFDSLSQKVDTVFIPRVMWKLFLDQLETSLTRDKTEHRKVVQNIHALLLAYTKLIEKAEEAQRKNVNKLRSLGYALVDLAKGDPTLTEKLLRKYKEASIYFAAHSVNVCLYSIAIGKKLGISSDELKNLGFSCLVHNIGNALIPPEILYKKGDLSAEEFAVVQNHAKQGAELLEYLDVPTEVALVAKQHHEHMDGNGYPTGLVGDEIHLFSRICSIADVYDALTSHKPYGEASLTPSGAIAIMQEMEGKFDPDIIKMIGSA